MTQPVDYALLDPTGNITLLVETPVLTAAQPPVARKLMELEPGTEQVGFVSPGSDGEIRLRMAGGEFCGNASMSAAALHLRRTGQREGPVSVRVAGTDKPVTVSLTALSDDAWRGTVTMPQPLSVTEAELPGGHCLPVVRFPGIAHVIYEYALSRDDAEALARNWCRYLGAEAVGLMLLDRAKDTLTPLVYVPAAGTLFWETSCASGTTAVGAWLAAASGQPVTLSLTQPGGTLTIAADADGRLLLTGDVRLMRRTSADITI